jgi:methyl-accepting chemotaxis protein
MAVRFAGFGWSEGLIVALSGVAGALVIFIFALPLTRGVVGELYRSIASDILDPDVRRSLVAPSSARKETLYGALGMSVIVLFFAVALFAVKRVEPATQMTLDWQERVLGAVANRLEDQNIDAAIDSVLGDRANLVVPLDVVLLPALNSDVAVHRALNSELLGLIKAERAAGGLSGTDFSRSLGQVWAWRALEDGRTLVALTSSRMLGSEASQSTLMFPLVLGFLVVLSAALMGLLSRETGQELEFVQAKVARMLGGDFRKGEDGWESGGEIGELSRSIEAMGDSMRQTVSRFSVAVSRVESTVSEISGISESVAAATADQVGGIQHASAAMESINTQVRGIADSSQVLNTSVEESSSSILELGASGQDLNETAGTLSSRVDEVSSSIEQMVRSVRLVVENAESLSGASLDTSSSMAEMATSLKEVDSSAETSARLSKEVVLAAESGQEKVRQTIDGMDAIRVATETAERVIRSLGSRTGEIGAVVNVIDDVAEETNLLALNAAIIAAQAGEHGKAFSVVADEIKDLADRVLASTKEIGVLIRAVQEESANAIGAIEQGTESVASGVDLSAEAGISLEEITRASRDSGMRIQEILTAVRSQSRAASHVVELMEKVRDGVEEIQTAAQEQERGNTVVYRSATTMREVAQQVRGTTEEQARGSSRIRESIEGVRDAVDTINSALQEQSAACRTAVEFLGDVYIRTQSNEQSVIRMEHATKGLLEQTETLRSDLERFQL